MDGIPVSVMIICITEPKTTLCGSMLFFAAHSKYFEVPNRRQQRLKLLEIGLGCGVEFGVRVQVELMFYDCVQEVHAVPTK